MEILEMSDVSSQEAEDSQQKEDLSLCKICSKTMSLNSARITEKRNVFKTARCCKQYGPVHIACAVKFCSFIDKDYQYDNHTYETDDTMPLYCNKCEQRCFFCNKQHTMGHPHVKLHVCPQCKKHWCYFYSQCKRADMSDICEVCLEENNKKDAATEDATSSLSRINKTIESNSPITSNCDPIIAKQLFQKATTIRELSFTLDNESDNESDLKIFEQGLFDNFTHLHPTEDNLFSPNVATQSPVNGLFISFNSIMNLFSDDKNIIVTDELIKMIVDLLNFFKEYSTTPNESTAKPIGTIIFQPKRKKDVLSELMLLITEDESNEGDHSLSLMYIFDCVWNIAKTGENKWCFEPEKKDLERNNKVWRRLFLNMKNKSYDIDEVWKLYETKLPHSSDQTHKDVRDLVNFAAPNVMEEFGDHIGQQTLTACTNTKTCKLNRNKVFLNGNHVDVFDHLRSFALSTILNSGQLKFESNFDENAVPKAQWKKGNVRASSYSQKLDLNRAQVVVNHIDHCMLKFTSYFMIGPSKIDSRDGKDKEDELHGDDVRNDKECKVIALAIVEKNVVMNSEDDIRPVIHYIMVDPEFRYKGVGSAFLKMMMNHKQYHDSKVMAVSLLHSQYRSVIGIEVNDPFFTKFQFLPNKRKKGYKMGDNDVERIVLKGSSVLCTEHTNIMSVQPSLKNYETDYGYYEIENTRKFSICVNPHDNCLYGKSAHYRWDKIDSEDQEAIPNTRIAMARKKIGHEVMLSSSGSRPKTKEDTGSSFKRSHASIPESMVRIEPKLKQSTYQNQHGCVWLSASMLLNSVNSELGMKMAKCYEEDKDKEQYEWLDLFPNKVRSGNRITIQRGSLVQKMQELRCGYHVHKIKRSNNRQSLCDHLIKERNDGLFVVILEDTDGIQQHAVGIDVGNKIIYDCMEDHTLALTVENLSTCCGNDAVFRNMKLGCELKQTNKRPKTIKHK